MDSALTAVWVSLCTLLVSIGLGVVAILNPDLRLPLLVITVSVTGFLLLVCAVVALVSSALEASERRKEAAYRSAAPVRVAIADDVLQVWSRQVTLGRRNIPIVGEETLESTVPLAEVKYADTGHESSHGKLREHVRLWTGRPSRFGFDSPETPTLLGRFPLTLATDASPEVVNALAERLRPERESYRLADYDMWRWPEPRLSLADLRARDPRPLSELP